MPITPAEIAELRTSTQFAIDYNGGVLEEVDAAKMMSLLDHIDQLKARASAAEQTRRDAVAIFLKEIAMAKAIAIEDCAKAGEAEAASWVGKTRIVQAARQGALTAVAAIRALALPAAPNEETRDVHAKPEN